MPDWLIPIRMSDSEAFSFIHPKSQKAGKLETNCWNSSDESIFTLNVDEDKRYSDRSSSEKNKKKKKKKKKKRINLEQDGDNTQVQLYDSPEEPLQKKKKSKCHDADESFIEDSVDLKNISLHLDNLEIPSFGDSFKKTHKKKKQHEDNTEGARVSDSQIACENGENIRPKKKKVKQHESCEYYDDNYCSNNSSVDQVISKKKHKKKHRDHNEVVEDVHLENAWDKSTKQKEFNNFETPTETTVVHQCQESWSAEITKKKRKERNREDIEFVDVEYSTTQNIENDPTSRKKRKKCDSTETIKKEKRTNSLQDNEEVIEDMEIVEENYDLKQKSKKKSINIQEEKEADECNKKAKHHSDSLYNKQKEKKHKKKDESIKHESDVLCEYDEQIAEVLLPSEYEEMQEQTPFLMENGLENGPKTQRKEKIKSKDVNVEELLNKSIEEQFLTQDQVAALDNLVVQVPFEVPPLHLIETQIIKALTCVEKTAIEKMGLTVKTGAYTKKEDEQIQKNWEWFCQLHRLNKEEPYLFTRFKHRNAKLLPASERFKFLRFLAYGLPDRLLCSVFRRFQRNFRAVAMNLGRFTEAEDKIILDYMKTHTGQVYLELSQILNRSRHSIERRYKKLITEEVSVKWSDELSIKLVKCLQKYCGVSQSELEHWDISLEEWKRVGEKMQIPVAKLKRIWLYIVYVKLFIKEDVNSKDIRKELIRTVCESGADDWKAVNWAQLAQKYKGFTPEKVCKIYRGTFEYHVPKGLQNNFRKGALYLKEQILEDSNGRLKGRTYTKLTLK